MGFESLIYLLSLSLFTSLVRISFSVYDRARTLMFKEECPFQISIVSDDRNKIYSREYQDFQKIEDKICSPEPYMSACMSMMCEGCLHKPPLLMFFFLFPYVNMNGVLVPPW